MEGLEKELEEYKRLYWPNGRCLSCDFPLPRTKEHKDGYTVCPNKDCDCVIRCPRPTCKKNMFVACGMCKQAGCRGCSWKCTTCKRRICRNCDTAFNCETCGGDWGGTNLCGDCMGPFRAHVVYYANNVKPPERLFGCKNCYEYWTTDEEFLLSRECEKCAMQDYAGQKCAQERCYNHFCQHKDEERKFCDEHNNKRAKTEAE